MLAVIYTWQGLSSSQACFTRVVWHNPSAGSLPTTCYIDSTHMGGRPGFLAVLGVANRCLCTVTRLAYTHVKLGRGSN